MTGGHDREKKPSSKKAWLVAAAFCFFADLIFLGDALLPGRVRAPADIVAATPPASGADLAPAPRNPYLADWALEIHPLHRLVRKSWASGRAPLWNAKAGTGEPLAARAESEAFSPYLPAILEGGDDDADWKTLAVMLTAQVSSLLLWRAFGGRVFGGLCLAFAFSFASSIQARILYPAAGVTAFAPAILWASIRLRRRATALRFAIAAAVVGATLAAGDPETAMIVIFGAAVLAAFDREPDDRRHPSRPAFALLAALVAGFLVAAPPVLLWATTARPEVVVEGSSRALPFRFLATLFRPFSLGWPTDPANPWRPAASPLDAVIFIGRFALALVPFGWFAFWRRDRRFLAGLCGVVGLALFLAFAPQAFVRRFEHVPLLGLASPRRFWVAAMLPLCLWSARGADFIGDGLANLGARHFAKFAVAAFALVILVEGFVVWRSFVPVVGRSLLAPAAPIETELEKLRPDRGLGLGRLFAPEIGAAWDTAIARSSHASSRARALAAKCSAAALDPAGGVDADPRLLDILGVRWLVSAWPIEETPRPAEPTLIEQGLPWNVKLDVPVGEPAEWLLVRPRHAGGAIAGDIAISCWAPGLSPIGVRPRGGVTGPVAGELGRFDLIPDAAVRELIASDFAEDDAVYFSFTCTYAGKTATMRYEIDPGGPPTFVMPIARHGAGPNVREIGKALPYRFSKRESALPRAFFTSNVLFADDRDDALRSLARSDFDIHAGAVVEGAERYSDRIFDTTPGLIPCDVVETPSGELRIVVNAPRAGFLCVMDDPAPGWSATLERGDDLEIHAADVVGRGVYVPAGKNVVIMRYRPWAYLLGVGLSGVTLCALSAGVLMRLGRTRKAGHRGA